MMVGGIFIFGWLVYGLIGHFSSYRDQLDLYFTFLFEGFYNLLSGKSYFMTNRFPWLNSVINLAIAFGMFHLGVKATERRDF